MERLYVAKFAAAFYGVLYIFSNIFFITVYFFTVFDQISV